MEDVIVELDAQGNKKETFYLVLYGTQVKVCNHTVWTQVTQPRRKVVKTESCDISWKRVHLLTLPRHLQMGLTVLPELAWISDGYHLHQCYVQDCEKHFKKYCCEPVEFLLSDDNYFVHNMKDPWCFDQENFQECLEDFIKAYNMDNQVPVKSSEMPKAAQLEAAWRIAYHSKPEIEDLIASGFLKIGS